MVTFKHDTEYEHVATGQPKGFLPVFPDLTNPNALGQEALQLQRYWAERDAYFARMDRLLDLADENRAAGLESMVSNDARTLFSLAVFLIAEPHPLRTVVVGGQGSLAERKSGLCERALEAWWNLVDEERGFGGRESFRHEMAYWMSLYGWHSVYWESAPDGTPTAIPLDPSECYPQWAGGLTRFVRLYKGTVGEAHSIATKYGETLPKIRAKDALAPVQIAEWWHGEPGEESHHTVLCHGIGTGWRFLKAVTGTGREGIPVLVGPVAGSPRRNHTTEWQSKTGTVFYENETIYRDFNKWISFYVQVAKEHALSPMMTRNIELGEEDLNPKGGLRAGRAVIESMDPQADIRRVDVGAPPVELIQLLMWVDGMRQRGGFPDVMYGGMGAVPSGFALSQLFQAAKRKVGAHLRRMEFVDRTISKDWLRSFRDGGATTSISGLEHGDIRQPFVEDFSHSSVPSKFGVYVSIPLNVGNDLIARMTMARQARGGTGPLLDQRTSIDKVLEMQDATLIMDRLDEDAARELTRPLRVALALLSQAEDIRAKGGLGAEDAAQLATQMAQQVLRQGTQATAPSPETQPPPEAMPPEARGMSEDTVRSMMGLGAARNLTAEEQRA